MSFSLPHRPFSVRTLRAALIACAVATPAWAASAQDAPTKWPERPITIIVPGAAGGTADIPSRILAGKLGPILGQSIIVENRAGSGGILGTQTVVRAPADGYTILIGNTGSNAINYSTYKQLPYKPSDFIPVTDMIKFPNVLVVNAQSPFKTVGDLVADLKNHPEKSSFASAGIGQTTHLTGELFKMRTNTQATHVPYRGSTPSMVALMSGEVTFLFDNLTQSLPQIRSGKLRPLAVTSAERQAVLPDVPTMAQAGVDDFVVSGWLGVFVSANTPPAIVEKLRASVAQVLVDPEVIDRFKEMGGVVGGMPQAQFATFVDAERERWADTIKKANLVLE